MDPSKPALVALVTMLILASVPAGADAARDTVAWSPEDVLSPLGHALMSDPGSARPRAVAFAADALASPTSLAALLDASLVHVHARADAPVPPLVAAPLAAEIARAHALAGAPLAPAELAALAREAAFLPPAVAEAAALLVAGANAAQLARGDPWRDIAPEELGLLAAHLQAGKAYVPSEAEDAFSMLLGPGAPTDLLRTQAALAKIDTDAILQAHRIMASAVDAAVARLLASDARIGVGAQRIGTPYGDIVVSGEGPDLHTDDRFVSIDMGGDDTYLDRAGGARAELLELLTLTLPPDPMTPAFVPWAEQAMELLHRSHNVSVSLDLDGADTYASAAIGAQGFGGFGGFGALVDLGLQPDVYTATSFAQGAGVVAGAGFLVDAGGDERYTADRQAQGYGHDAGAGILADASGVDRYSASVLAQGTGYGVNVVGMLVDAHGDDVYDCTGILDFSESILQVNAPRPGSICHAAGFGGNGVLIDGGGHDVYWTAASFQAMSLIGMGLLVDITGSDIYTAGEWSNGVGVLGAAAIVDLIGDDAYVSRQVITAPWLDTYIGSNAEGYVGVGIIVDGTGWDRYESVATKGLWLPQYACGAGCAYAAGAGILVDGAGSDRYTSEIGQGGALLGLGMLVDAEGSDRYTLTQGSIQGQGFADASAPNLVIDIELAQCYYGVLWDLSGADLYNNPVTSFGARGDGRYWGQNDFGRGMDGIDGTLGYLTSPEALADAGKIAASHACESISGPAIEIACQLLGRPGPLC